MTAECSVAGGTEGSAAGGAENFVTQEADCSVAGGTEHFVARDAECFGGAFLFGSAHYHPSLLHAPPPSCKWGNAVPMSTFFNLIRHHHGMGDCCNLGWFFCLHSGGRCGGWGRGNWPVFSCLK